MKDSFLRVGVVSYLISDYPNVVTARLFKDGQIAIWSVEGSYRRVILADIIIIKRKMKTTLQRFLIDQI